MKKNNRLHFLIPLFLLGAIQASAQTSQNPKEIVWLPGTGSSADRANSIATLISQLNDAGGGTLYLAAGIYRLTPKYSDKAIPMNGFHNIRIRGDGDATILRQDSTANLSPNLFYLNNCSGITFENLRFEGLRLQNSGGDGQYHTAIQADGGSDIHVLRCSFYGFKTGAVILQGSASRSSVEGCQFDRVDNRFSGDYGAIHLGGASDILIRGNQFWGLRYSGVSLSSGGSRIQITDNIMRFDMTSGNSMGIYITGGIQNCIFSNNHVFGPKYEGMDIRTNWTDLQTQDNIIENNILETSFVGVALNPPPADPGPYPTPIQAIPETRYNSIQGNVISGFTNASGLDRVDHGILPQKAYATLISGNMISKCQAGINLQNYVSENLVSANTVQDADGMGVFAPGAAIVSQNLVKSAGTGIGIAYTQNSSGTHASVTDNVLSSVGTRMSYGVSVSGATVLNNCDINGVCN